MACDPKAPEAMECQQEEEAAEGGDELSQASARSLERTVTYLARSHSADQALRFSGLSLGFLARQGR